MTGEEIKKRIDVLGPVFVRMVKIGLPCSLVFSPDHEYELAIVPDYDDSPENGGLIMAAMIGHPDCHLVKTDEGELLVVHKEDQ